MLAEMNVVATGGSMRVRVVSLRRPAMDSDMDLVTVDIS